MLLENHHELPSYDQVEQSLIFAGLPMSPAFVHGILCGSLTSGRTMEGATWLNHLFVLKDPESLGIEKHEIFLQLYEASVSQLKNMDFSFQMLLPIDDENLPERAQALSSWCEGYIQGLNSGGLDVENGKTNDTKNALLHISEISEIDYTEISVTEQDEKAYIEVIEYIRMAILMIYAEFNKLQGAIIIEDEKQRGTIH